MNAIDKKVLQFIDNRDLKKKWYAEWLGLTLTSFYVIKNRAKKEIGTPFSEGDYVLILIEYRNYLREKITAARKEKLVTREFSTRNNLCEICMKYDISLKRASTFMGLNYKTLLTKRKQYYRHDELNLLLSNIRNFFESELRFINNELETYKTTKKKIIRNKELGKMK
jgi:hypothetical protein